MFEDIIKLDDRSIQLVLREADQKDLALALRGVSDEVKQRILSNMSERGAQMLLEEMEYQPPQRKRVVEEAQGRIVAIVRKLEEAGAVVLSRGEADAVLARARQRPTSAPTLPAAREPADRSDRAGLADVLWPRAAEAEQIRAQARAAGEAEGRAAGSAAVRAEAEPALARSASAAQSALELQ